MYISDISLEIMINKAIKLIVLLVLVFVVSCENDLPKVHNVSDISTMSLYKKCSDKLKLAFDFIEKNGIDGLKKMSGRVNISGNDVFANISDIKLTPNSDELIFEAHDKFIDIHLILEGEEIIGIKNRKECKNLYSDKLSENDYILFKETPTSLLKLSSGKYIVLFPKDAHAPSLGKGKVRKCVIKVAVY